jgi:hypothetical protein
MPYEGLANALAQIGNDYAQHADEKRRRSEKLSDTASQRDYERGVRSEGEASAVRLAKEQAAISFAAKLKEIDELEPKRAQMALLIAAKGLGIENAESLSPSALRAQIVRRQTEEGAALILAQAVAANTAKNTVEDTNRNDPNFAANVAKDRENTILKHEPEIRAALNDYDTANAALKALKASDANLAAVPLTLADHAQQKAAEFLTRIDTLPPAQREAPLLAAAPMMSGAKTGAAARAAILANPAQWAKESGAISEKDVANIERAAVAHLRANGYADRPDIQGLIQRINHNAVTLVKWGFTPGVPFERQSSTTGGSSYFAPSADEGDAGTPAPAPTAAPSGPNFSTGAAPAALATQAAPGGPAPAPAAAAGPGETGGLIGLGQRFWNGIPSAAGRALEIPGRIDRAIGAAATGVLTGDYSVPPVGGLGQIGQKLGEVHTAAVDRHPYLRPPAHAAVSPGPVDHVREAELWLSKNGVNLPPAEKAKLVSEFQTVVTSALPDVEKNRLVTDLQRRALAQKQPAAPGLHSYWGR